MAKAELRPLVRQAAIPGWTQSLWTALDGFASALLKAENDSPARKKYGDRPARRRQIPPEEDVRQLMIDARELEDVWEFFLKRLNQSSQLDLMCFSVLDDSADFIRLNFLHPQNPDKPFDKPIISMSDRNNHLVQASQRKDTTFTSRPADLGEHLQAYLQLPETSRQHLNIFTAPFIAGGRVIAMITLGFSEVDAFSQAKLSYVYTLRDQIAQLVWNLTLQDRMKSQAQIDTLTGLMTHTYFQRVLEAELKKAQRQNQPLTTMVVDIANIKEINRNCGHDVGDDAICHLASMTRRLIRGIDTVARYGGDEIVLVLPETGPEDAETMACRLIKGLNAQKLPKLGALRVNIGYATFPHDTQKKDNLLKFTEQALHLAKFKAGDSGVSNKVAYHEAMALNDKTVLEVFASQVAKQYDNHHLFDQLITAMERPGDVDVPEATSPNLMLETIGSLAGALDAKDRYTRGHSQAVANYAVAVAHALELPPSEVEKIRLAAFLHDIGKIGIPESILCKQGPLNEAEWAIMKQHPVIGARQILAPVSALRDVIPLVEFHHENWDGSGYPSGLKGEEIPLGARIVSIVDAFHGLTSDRSYRQALPVAEAARILGEGAGAQWDPELIEVFIKILNVAKPILPVDALISENEEGACLTGVADGVEPPLNDPSLTALSGPALSGSPASEPAVKTTSPRTKSAGTAPKKRTRRAKAS
ncbi:MAG: diguanylate cyclase [Vampirovibrionales bacterium]|nr:diguanylate cyclase [Vampirovibrionales bacterium]